MLTCTDVKSSDGIEINCGDRIRITLPARSIWKGMILAEGEVFFSHGSFRIPKKDNPNDSSRLDDFAPDCLIEIIK